MRSSTAPRHQHHYCHECSCCSYRNLEDRFRNLCRLVRAVIHLSLAPILQLRAPPEQKQSPLDLTTFQVAPQLYPYPPHSTNSLRPILAHVCNSSIRCILLPCVPHRASWPGFLSITNSISRHNSGSCGICNATGVRSSPFISFHPIKIAV